jgi:hypothetical protein
VPDAPPPAIAARLFLKMSFAQQVTTVAQSASSSIMSKGIDYSKWEKMDLSDSDSSDGTPKATAAATATAPQSRLQQSSQTSQTAKVSIEIDKPQVAEGSSWNVRNFHWEEQDLDK